MRGHIRKRAKDSWTLVLNLGRDPGTGKRKQQWVSVKGTKKDAERKLAELIHQADNGGFVKPAKETLGSFLNRWLKEYAKASLSPRSLERYEGVVRVNIIPSLGDIPLTRLKPEQLQKYYTAMLNAGLSGGTVRYHHALLHVALKTAVKWYLVSRNVADAVDPPRVRRVEMRTWDEESINRFLLAAKSTPYYALFYTALFTGMRRSEILALRWQDVDFILGQVYVHRSLHHLKDGSYVYTEPKSANGRRTIALPPSATLALRNHYEKEKATQAMMRIALTDDALLFSNPDGKPWRPDTISRAWRNLATRCGLPRIRFHDARHSHASLMLKQGVHPKIVQERLGHASIQITLDVYSHVSPGLQQMAAAQFDEILDPERGKEPVDTMR